MAGFPQRSTSGSSGGHPPATARLCLTLDLELEGDPVVGVLRGGGVEESFFGWSGLARAIELALEAHWPDGSGPGADGGGK